MTEDGQQFAVSDTLWKVNWEVQKVLQNEEEEDADGDDEEEEKTETQEALTTTA